MNLKFSIFLALSMSLFAQRGDTIYQTLFKNVGVGGSATSPAVRTIGQSMHYVYVSMKDAPSQTCAPVFPNVSFDIFIQGSYDGVSYFNLPFSIASSTLLDTGKVSRLFLARGAFPYMQVILSSLDGTNCRYDGYYSGALYPGALNELSIGIGGSGGLRTKSGPISTAGDNGLLFPNTYTVSVYGMTLCNTTANQTVQLTDQTGLTVYQKFPAMAAGQCVIWPVSSIPYFNTTFPSTGLGINLANATSIFYTIQYRFE